MQICKYMNIFMHIYHVETEFYCYVCYQCCEIKINSLFKEKIVNVFIVVLKFSIFKKSNRFILCSSASKSQSREQVVVVTKGKDV